MFRVYYANICNKISLIFLILTIGFAMNADKLDFSEYGEVVKITLNCNAPEKLQSDFAIGINSILSSDMNGECCEILSDIDWELYTEDKMTKFFPVSQGEFCFNYRYVGNIELPEDTAYRTDDLLISLYKLNNGTPVLVKNIATFNIQIYAESHSPQPLMNIDMQISEHYKDLKINRLKYKFFTKLTLNSGINIFCDLVFNRR